MAENLKVTHYNNGEEIPTGYSNSEWTELETGAYAVYPTDDDNASQATCGDDCADMYGNLYNWYAVDDDRGVCPDGYHIPSDEEFMALEMFLGMSEEEANSTGWRGTNEGSKLAGNSDLWNDGDLENNSEFGTSGFNGLPAGYRGVGVFGTTYYHHMGSYGYFWSSSEVSSIYAWHRELGYGDSYVRRTSSFYKQYGFIIRCLADEITTGCTDPEACNYDETANVDDGSCEYYDPEIMCDCDETFLDVNGDCCGYLVMDECMVCNGDGTSCDGVLNVPSEYSTIQSAIDAASEGDSVLVSAGTYYEYVSHPSSKHISILSVDGREATIIDGSNNGLSPVINFNNGSATTEIDSNFIFKGFTIRGGDGYSGIKCYNSSILLEDLIIENNNSTWGCGGLLIDGVYSTIKNIIIRNNSTEDKGGGLYIRGGSIIDIENIKVIANSSSNGGGIYIENSEATLSNIIINDNTAGSKGGGIYLNNSSISGSYVLINNNYSEGHGAGIFISAGSNINLNKSTIVSNMVGEGGTFGAGIYADGGTATLINSIVYYNRREGDYGINYNMNGYTMDILDEYTVSYSDIEGDENWIPDGEGNISITPEVNDFENGNFTLQSTSPCIDAGDPESELDPDGTITDMGAFYYDQSSSCDEGYTEINGECYYQSDLDVLENFIDNSTETINWEMDVNSNNIIEPLELGIQLWFDGRLTELRARWNPGGGMDLCRFIGGDSFIYWQSNGSYLFIIRGQ